MKKTFLSFLLCWVMILGITGCSGSENNNNNNNNNSSSNNTNFESEFAEENNNMFIRDSMTDEEIKEYVSTYLEQYRLWYHGGVTYDGDYKNVKYYVEKNYIYFDAEKSIIYVIDNEQIINAIGENLLKNSSIEDIISNDKIKNSNYDLNKYIISYNIDEYLIGKYTDSDKKYIQLSEKNNDEFYIRIPENCNYITYAYSKYRGATYFYFDYGDALSDTLDYYNDFKNQNSKLKPKIGMTTSEVKKSTWGEPDKINKDTYSWGVKEQWVYKKRGYIYFENGIVTSISER